MVSSILETSFYQDVEHKHKEWLTEQATEVSARWHALQSVDRELALCQAAFRDLMESYGARVEPNELNIVGPTFLCTLDESRFFLHPTYVHMDIDPPPIPALDTRQFDLRNKAEIVARLVAAIPECPITNVPLLLAVCAYGPESKYSIAPLQPYDLLINIVDAKPRYATGLSGLLICSHTYRGGQVVGATIPAKNRFRPELLSSIRFASFRGDDLPASY